uniref:uncharacterized methyltransferase YdaC-like n=1 Tax=Styela clava TaxID=7725 RepID=UPI0019398B19|nr:uncharacterized methyltransferase YdaC-like [Styela clava]
MCIIIKQRFEESIARNLRRPSNDLYGFIIKRFLITRNEQKNRKVIELLQLQSHHNILEIGFGPGEGLKLTLDTTGHGNPSGRIYGVDFSSRMCEEVQKRFCDEIDKGRMSILNEDVSTMSIPDNTIDKVFHINSHLYWPDIDKSCAEIYRVMKSCGNMVTVVNFGAIESSKRSSTILKYAVNSTPEIYTNALVNAGFVDIEMTTVGIQRGHELKAILCTKP